MPRPYTWESLAAATLRRQFPAAPGRGAVDADAVAAMVGRVGPIQSQVARAPFVTMSSRLPGADRDAVTQAYESYAIVRASNLRGTVHTCARDQHRVLDAVTRRSMEKLWRRSLKLERVGVGDVQRSMERFATGGWRTPEELRAHLVDWIRAAEGDAAADAAATTGVGRAMAHVHSGLIRRPLADGGWDRQTPPGYRDAAEALDEPPRAGDDPAAALIALTRQHLRAFGPASRRDVAWWTGAGLRNVDAAMTALADELTERPGPGGETFFDLAEPPAAGSADPGVRMLPEYDALVVGYDPTTRARFLDPAHLPEIWISANGSFSPSVLVEGRLAASWRIVAEKSRRRIEVVMFPGRRRLREDDLADQVAAIEAVLGIEVSDVTVAAA